MRYSVFRSELSWCGVVVCFILEVGILGGSSIKFCGVVCGAG